jgi:hypothetical protein
MPESLLNDGAQVQCVHVGQAKPRVSNPRVRVAGQQIVTASSIYDIFGCHLAGTGSPPCATAQWQPQTAAKRLRARGEPVLLKNSRAVCVPTTTGLNVTATQLRVKGT